MRLASLAGVVLVAALALGGLTPRVALATPSLDGCTGILEPAPGDEPIVVATPGVWCLASDFDDGATEATIAVAAHDVTIDCRGHRIGYDGFSPFVMGIRSYSQRTTVRNCRMNGFTVGIGVFGLDYLIEDNVVEYTRPSFTSEYPAGIIAFGPGTVRRNRIRHGTVMGLRVAEGARVLDNLVDEMSDDGFNPAFGIYIDGHEGVEVGGNTVRGLHFSAAGPPYGIFVRTHGTAAHIPLIHDNVLVGDGSSESRAVTCDNYNVARIKDNVVTGFEVLNTDAACVDAGGNDHTP
jgi:hypothetical protein